MSSTTIRQQIDDLITNSRVFSMLDKLDQLNFLKQLETATDEQILATVQVIEEEESNLILMEKRKLEIAKKQVELAENLRKDMKDAEKFMIKEKEAAESQASAQLLRQMDAEIDKLAPTNKAPKDKKFLGLF